MKLIVTLALCVALLAATTPTLGQQAPPPQPQSVALVCFMLGCCLVGMVLVVTIYSCSPPRGPVTVILYESCDGRATWTPVATNTVVLGTNAPIAIFSQIIDGAPQCCFFKAVVVK